MSAMDANTFNRTPLDEVTYISLAAFGAAHDAMCEVCPVLLPWIYDGDLGPVYENTILAWIPTDMIVCSVTNPQRYPL